MKRVTSGFKGLKEINTITYDSRQITVEEMTEVLKAAGTYRGIAE